MKSLNRELQLRALLEGLEKSKTLQSQVPASQLNHQQKTLNKLITTLNDSFNSAEAEFTKQNKAHEEIVRKAEAASSELKGQLGLINTQSESLEETRQTVSNLIADLTKWSNHVEAQLKVLQADKQELSKGAVAEIQQVANNLVTKYLENVKIIFQNTRNWRKQM